jgi:outer membrane biosynthesis protein TonB
MAFRLRIEADGSVSDVEVIEDTLRREEVRDCALTQIREWKFAPAASQTVFETPFVFRPRR